jgi:16S rRNA A1518/A1519 N6-dimethyltransferase RsmA/KsgA/DIM1 with predicted DNA glycosylase/AP lyase activity
VDGAPGGQMIVEDPERREVDALLALWPAEPPDVVELGCGEGRLTLRYADRARAIFAIDPDEARIAAFRAAPPPANVTIRAVGVDRFDRPDESADVVLLAWSL